MSDEARSAPRLKNIVYYKLLKRRLVILIAILLVYAQASHVSSQVVMLFIGTIFAVLTAFSVPNAGRFFGHKNKTRFFNQAWLKFVERSRDGIDLKTESSDRKIVAKLATVQWSYVRGLLITRTYFCSFLSWIFFVGATNATQEYFFMTTGEWSATLALAGIGILGGYIHRHRFAKMARDLVKHLELTQDVRLIPPLVGALQSADPTLRPVVKRVLTDMLPKLKASDCDSMSPDVRAYLLKWVVLPSQFGAKSLDFLSVNQFRKDIDFRIAILKAFEQIGGPSELSDIERLANRAIYTGYARGFPDVLVEAARQCLPYLKERMKVQQAAAQLVRASSVDSAEELSLLHPADTGSKDRSEELLRIGEPRSSFPSETTDESTVRIVT